MRVHRIPNTADAEMMRDGPDHPIVVVPYVNGMLRPETEHAVAAWGGRYTLYPLDPQNPYAYAELFYTLWNRGSDLVFVEQDVVPAFGDITEILQCPEQWCSHRYHVGEGRYTYGLGFCKFAQPLQLRLHTVGYNAARHPSGGQYNMPWQGLNESIERALTRRGAVMHQHDTVVRHLHYPEPTDAG